MIQIRHVPDATHRLLKSRAASMGLTLSEYPLRTAVQAAEAPTDDEILARLAALEPVQLDDPDQVVDIIREARGPIG